MTAYNSMLALLETQLPYDCHIHKTSIHENGISVSIKKVQGEIIRFFLTDNSLARACFAMNKQGVKCCDYLLLYTKENTTKKTELLCFIELKGKDIDKAGKQILDTSKHIAEFSQQHLDKKQQPNVTKAAAIFLHERAPAYQSRRERDKLARIFDITHIDIKHGVQRGHDIGQFIRSIYP